MAIPEVQQFRDIWAAKVAAKEKVMAALGQALIFDRDGVPSDSEWAIVEAQGMASGVEGKKQAEAQKLCDDLYLAHPEYFSTLEGKDSEQIVTLIDLYLKAGLEDDATLATMYELAKFERQQIGAKLTARVRLPGRN